MYLPVLQNTTTLSYVMEKHDITEGQINPLHLSLM